MAKPGIRETKINDLAIMFRLIRNKYRKLDWAKKDRVTQ